MFRLLLQGEMPQTNTKLENCNNDYELFLEILEVNDNEIAVNYFSRLN